MTAKITATARVAALRQRRAEQGLVRLDLYVHPDDHAAVKAVAQALTQRRLSNRDCTQTVSDPIQSKGPRNSVTQPRVAG
jgi:hypothetical protein